MPRTAGDVREGVITYKIAAHAAEKGLEDAEAITAGLQEKAGEFKRAGGEVYLSAK